MQAFNRLTKRTLARVQSTHTTIIGSLMATLLSAMVSQLLRVELWPAGGTPRALATGLGVRRGRRG